MPTLASAPPLARPWLQGLNPPQLDAATTLDGAVLVLAGAGTGKTRALIARLAQILAERRAWPSQILAVTFTNKAANELRARLQTMVGEAAESMPFVGTFHSIAARILRRHAELVGLRPNFTILDTDDCKRLLKRLIVGADIDEKRWPARQLAQLIDSWKNRGLGADAVPAGESLAFADGAGARLYGQYQAELLQLNAADFGDLLLHCLRIFADHAEVLADWQARFRYVLVDEYQDTNAAQYRWLTLLAAPSHGGQGNICCVGDDDQSIYSWRGADVTNLLRFETDFPGARVIRLEQNYRSTPHILAAASAVIANNRRRLGKTLWTDRNGGEKVEVISLWDGAEEARVVGDRAQRLIAEGASPADIAILVRAGFQTREFEDRFIAIGLDYRIVGGFRFYERAEIRDALAYLRVIAQEDDALAFERIVNVPKRGIGAQSMAKVQQYARAHGLSLPRAAQAMVEAQLLPAAARKSLARLLALFDGWRARLHALSQSELTQTMLEESGYLDMLHTTHDADSAGRIENLGELVRAMEAFTDLEGFLEHVALVMENDRGDTQAKVTLMTLHAAKGLEFGYVFLPGWEEGLFPNQRALDEGGTAALEEERRLAYVGITRAKRRATILHAANRRVYGQWLAAIPSRFLDELPADNIARESTISGHPQPWFAATAGFPAVVRPPAAPAFPERPRPQSMRPERRGRHADSPSAPPRPDIEIAARVFHDKFGMGTVRAKTGNKLEIEFDHSGTKMVLDSFVKLV